MPDPGLDLKERKRAARKDAEIVRQQAKQAVPDAAQLLANHFMKQINLPPASIISSYVARGSELDPAPLEHALLKVGHSLCLPVVLAKGYPLAFRRYQPGDVLEPGGFGIPEPLVGVAVVNPTVILVPLLGFDRQGGRLGYGGGFYDRSVALLRRESAVLAIGIGYAAQEMAELPTGRTDAKLDWVVNEREAIKC
jgi:5-formyltetrahydrofolate cyclo-ligase